MKCLGCDAEMKCHDDMNNISTLEELLKCPSCGAAAVRVISQFSKKVLFVEWGAPKATI